MFVDRAHRGPDILTRVTGTGADLLPAVVVFDLGMVLSTPVDLIGRLIAVATADVGRVDDAGFERGYWAHRAAYDAGSSDSVFWGAVLADAGVRSDPALVVALTDADCRIWADLPTAPRQLIADLAAAGTRLGLLSNAPASMGRYVRTRDWAQPFEQLSISAEMGLVKPDPAIYAAVTGLFGVEPGTVIFFDDRPDNVAGAWEHGWQAHIWTGIADARAALQARGALPGPVPAAPSGQE